jgi:hypothetical protein
MSVSAHPFKTPVPKVGITPRRALIFLFATILLLEGLYLPLLFQLGLESAIVRGVLYLKYALATVMGLAFGLQYLGLRHRIFRFEMLGLISTLMLIAGSLTHLLRAAPVSASIYTVYLFPIIVYFAGRTLHLREVMVRRVMTGITLFWILLAVYAITDVLLLGPQLWQDFLAQGQYLFKVKGYTEGVIDGLIGNFYYDPYALRLRRAVGTQGDPLAFAYAAVVPLATLFFIPHSFRKYRIPFLIIGLLALLMSLTRAVVLSLLIVLSIRRVFKRSFPVWTFAFGFGTSLFLFSGGSGLVEQVLEFFGWMDSSTRGHLGSFDSVLEVPWPDFLFGAAWISSQDLHNFEPAVFNLVTNYGILTTTCFYLFLLLMLWRLNRTYGQAGVALAVAGATGVITSFVFSESFFSFTGYGLFWLLAGTLISSESPYQKRK